MSPRQSRVLLSLPALLILTSLWVSASSAPRARLKELVAQLQENPADYPLREAIIKLALTLKPMPVVADEAEVLAGRGSYLMKKAKSPDDYAAAAEAFGKAVLVAPWVGDHYFNLALAQEKAGEYTSAKTSLKLYLLARPDAKDRREVLSRMGELDVQAEEAARAAQSDRAARAKIQQVESVLNDLKRKTEGVVYQQLYCNVGGWNNGKGPGGSLACNQAETQGSNWYDFWRGDTTFYFAFPGDGTVLLCMDRDSGSSPRPQRAKWGRTCQPQFVGSVDGPQISWLERVDYRQEGEEIHITQTKPIWYQEDTMRGVYRILFSWDRPMNNAAYNSEARYRYAWFVPK